jgi:hypothetical protein
MARKLTIQQLNKIILDIRCMDYMFSIVGDGDESWCLMAQYYEKDVVTGRHELQETRLWPLPSNADRDAVVRTAFKCVMTSLEHRARGHFTWRERSVFGPHMSLDALWEAAPVPKL